jgi:Protein of unknown function (DUF2889)
MITGHGNRTVETVPPRRPDSLRRTSSIQSLWPDGIGGPHIMPGRARDLFTGRDGAPVVLAEDEIRATMTPDRRIAAMEGSRDTAMLAQCSGMRPGGELRKFLSVHLPDEISRATLLYRLLDEMGGGAFMAVSAWHSWLPGGEVDYAAEQGLESATNRPVEGVCLSFQRGSVAMTDEGRTNEALADHPFGRFPQSPDDPQTWHPFVASSGPNHLRVRRTDVWLEDDMLHVDAWFQDSTALPDRSDARMIFHEYGIMATIDPESFVLRKISVTPRVLPYSSCFAAPETAARMIGEKVTNFASQVPIMLRGTLGCTHLNEMLRSLHDVPVIAMMLSAQSS